MLDAFKNIKAVGFDLDGTLYKITPQIDDRVKTMIAEKILEKKPELGTLENALKFHIEKFQELESSFKTVVAAGYTEDEASLIMKRILEESDITDLIPEDPELVKIIEAISEKYYTYLISTSPSEAGIKKLRAIGLKEDSFNSITFGDAPWFTKQPKTVAFEHAIKSSNIPAEEHIYIGDRKKADILFPKELGMHAVAVYSQIPEADFSIDNIHAIKDLLL